MSSKVVYTTKIQALESFESLKKINSCTSNYFLTRLNQNVYTISNKECSIILNQERDIYRLYYCYCTMDAFEDLLSQLPNNKKICLEYISKDEINQDFAARIENIYITIQLLRDLDAI